MECFRNRRGGTAFPPTPMKTETVVRFSTGAIVLVSLALATFVNAAWLTLAAFIAVNLLQSAFTGICGAELLVQQVQRLFHSRSSSATKTDVAALHPPSYSG